MHAGHQSETGWGQPAPELAAGATRRAVFFAVGHRTRRSCLLVLALIGGVRGEMGGRGGLRMGVSGSSSGACIVAEVGAWRGRGGLQGRCGGLASLRGGGAKLHPLSYPWLSHNWNEKNYYLVLGVAEDAAYQDIKDVYRSFPPLRPSSLNLRRSRPASVNPGSSYKEHVDALCIERLQYSGVRSFHQKSACLT